MRVQVPVAFISILVLSSPVHAQTPPKPGTSTQASEAVQTEPATIMGFCVPRGAPKKYITYVLADGGLSTNGAEKNSVPASGSIAFRHLADGQEFRASIGLKSVTDTLHGTNPHAFAASLLAPASVGGTGSIDLTYSFFRCVLDSTAKEHHGVKFRIGALRTNWAFDTTSKDKVTAVQFAGPVTIVNAAILYSAVFVNQVDKSGNLLAFGTEIGPVVRWYLGERTDDAFKNATLGTTEVTFFGVSAAAWARFHNLVVSGEFPVLHAKPRAAWTRAAGPIVTFTLEAPIYTIMNPPLP